MSEREGDFGRGKRNKNSKAKVPKSFPPPSDVHYNKGIAKKEREADKHTNLPGKGGKSESEFIRPESLFICLSSTVSRTSAAEGVTDKTDRH